jgi:hypothetical protein
MNTGAAIQWDGFQNAVERGTGLNKERTFSQEK